MNVDWERIYERWLMSGECDILEFGSRADDFIRHLLDEGHRPNADELRDIVEMTDLIDGDRLDARMRELAAEDWDIEAILVG